MKINYSKFPSACLVIKREASSHVQADIAIANIQAELANRYAERGQLKGEKAVGVALDRILRES